MRIIAALLVATSLSACVTDDDDLNSAIMDNFLYGLELGEALSAGDAATDYDYSYGGSSSNTYGGGTCAYWHRGVEYCGYIDEYGECQYFDVAGACN